MLELFTAICGLIQSILIMLNKKENWIFYMMNIGALTLFSFRVKLYGDVMENSIYILFGLIGLCTWYSERIAGKLFEDGNHIRFCSNKERILYTIMFLIISATAFVWLVKTDDPSPFLDAITTGMGCTATLMMALKRVEAWYVWLIDDILMAYIYYSLPEHGFWLMLLNIIWVGLAIGSILTWTKEANKRKGKKDSVKI